LPFASIATMPIVSWLSASMLFIIFLTFCCCCWPLIGWYGPHDFLGSGLTFYKRWHVQMIVHNVFVYHKYTFTFIYSSNGAPCQHDCALILSTEYNCAAFVSVHNLPINSKTTWLCVTKSTRLQYDLHQLMLDS
jgi:hypothetical protein